MSAAAIAGAAYGDGLQGLDVQLEKTLGATKLDSTIDDLAKKSSLPTSVVVVGAVETIVANGSDGGTCVESVESVEKEATFVLDDLLRFRDRYFESHSLRDAHRKKVDVAAEIDEALTRLEKLQERLTAAGRQAVYLTLRGRINNANQSYSEAAYLDLSKAIKLDPRLSDAWNALGECYWYKGDMEEARNCFEGSIKRDKNKAALRNVSIVMRQLLPDDQEEKFVGIRESVEKAKEAVSLDTNDGMSWYVLGTAYLSLFFISNQNPKVLRQCLSAYSQAEKDPSVKNLPDLHYNRAMAQKHMEEYKPAITGFHTAYCLEPDWDDARRVRDDILLFLRTLQDHVQTRGKIKGKKLASFVNSIKPEVALGPFGGSSGGGAGGSAQSSRDGDNKTSPKFTHLPFRQLSPGLNPNKVVVGKVTSSVTNDCITAFAFTMVDADKDCVAVTLYNLKAGVGVIIGDTVAIAEPFMEKIHFEFDPDEALKGTRRENESDAAAFKSGATAAPASSNSTLSKAKFEFTSLRVPTPVMVVVNGKKWGRDKEAFTEMRVSSQPAAS